MYRIISASFDEGTGGNHRSVEALAYSYDGVGNRAQVTETHSQTGVRNINYTTNEVNQYTEIDGASFLYSNNGNLTNSGSNLYIYDYKNRLIEVAEEGGGATIAKYFYHSDNRRSVKTVSGSETRYFYDRWQVCEEQSSSGSTLVSYVYSPTYVDAPIQLERTADHPLGAGTVYLHQNAQYNVVASTDESGAIAEKLYYNDFGLAFDDNKQPVSGSTIGNPYGFQGRRLDPETGLYYFRNRYYDPATGRFLQRDPMWDPSNVGNQYAFVGNSPLSSFDPLGLENCDKKKLFDDLEEAKKKLEALRDERKRVIKEMKRQKEAMEAVEDEIGIIQGLLDGRDWGDLLLELGWTAVPFSTEIDLVVGDGSRLEKGGIAFAQRGAQAVLLTRAPKFGWKTVAWISGGGAIASVVAQWIGKIGMFIHERWVLNDLMDDLGKAKADTETWGDLLHEKLKKGNKDITDMKAQLAKLQDAYDKCDQPLQKESDRVSREHDEKENKRIRDTYADDKPKKKSKAQLKKEARFEKKYGPNWRKKLGFDK